MGSVRRSFRRLSERSGDQAKIGDVRFFERDPGSNWLVCSGQILAASPENKRLFAPDTGSLSTTGLTSFRHSASPNRRGAILGDNVVIPQSSGGVRVFRSANRGQTWSAVLSLGSGNSADDTVVFDGKIVMAFNRSVTPFRVSSDGGASWSELTQVTVDGRTLVPYRMKVIGGALYAVSFNGREFFRTMDLASWTMIPLPDNAVDFNHEGGLLDFDFDPINGEWVFVTSISNRQGFYSSRDLATWTKVGLVLEGYLDYLNFSGGVWIATGSKAAVRTTGGFVLRPGLPFSTPPVWTGAEFVGRGSAAMLGVSTDMVTVASKPVEGFTQNSPVYYVYQFADGDLLAAQTSATETQTFALSRTVRAPVPPALRPSATRGKPYVRVR